MKGILGRKTGMTSVFSDHGRAIPVTVIEVQPNIVTQVLSKDKHGYDGLQLAVFDRREKTSTKPLVGHFKKANTTAKRFVREVRGMAGFELGAHIDASIFKAGELVDVSGTSKGHGFQGTIKRHNQTIGPKSHGGGGGSQPLRQTGSLGDMVSNRVFKGMTMPGHMGVDNVTVQNLEVVSVDIENNVILVRGSIPGQNKSFVVIRQAVKGLPNLEAVKLVNVKESGIKNHLLEEAKKAGADVNTDMTVQEMKAAIEAAGVAQEAAAVAKEAEDVAKKAADQAHKLEEAAQKAHVEAEKAKASGDETRAHELEIKAEQIDKQAHHAEEVAKEAVAEAKVAEVEAAKAEAISEKLQVETETVAEEAKGGNE